MTKRGTILAGAVTISLMLSIVGYSEAQQLKAPDSTEIQAADATKTVDFGSKNTSVAPAKPPDWSKTVEILSDTKGVDFGPYLTNLVKIVRTNWFNLVPEEARPPQLRSGETKIEFAIMKGGNIAGMKIVGASGSVNLDRAAWGGITSSAPLIAPLPKQFKGEYLSLRMTFVYNPKKSASDSPDVGPAGESKKAPPVPQAEPR